MFKLQKSENYNGDGQNTELYAHNINVIYRNTIMKTFYSGI